ncbi:hypothetical protein [Elioraea sp.]|uniref:hypothetical protein n=1 Tax=Elioraea sp. TaxID=2185103 RepID=UPI003F72B008
MTPPAVSDETLTAFADGELDAAEATSVRAAVAADPALARRLAALREARAAIRAAFADVANEPVPTALIAAVLAADATDAPPPRAANAPVWRAAAIAATVALVVGGLAGALLVPGPTRVADRLDPLGAAAPVLADVLDRAASGEAVAFDGGTVRLLASYPTTAGPCRAFMVDGPAAVSGLACREDTAWRMRVVVARPPPEAGFAPAFGEDPLVRDLLDRLGAGAPLDPASERSAIDRAWR